MANPNAPFGARPVHMRNGSPDVVVRPYYVKSDYATALYVGAPVSRIAGDSNAAVIKAVPNSFCGGADEFPAGSLQKVELAANGDTVAITGFVVSIGTATQAGSAFGPAYRPASKEAVVFVADHPDTIFEIQASAALASTDIGKVTNLTGSGGNATVTGLSSVQLDAAAVATGNSTYQLRIVGVSKDPSRNDLASAYPVMLVQINNHTDVDVAKAGV